MNNSYLAQYKTPEAVLAAVNSYGGVNSEPFQMPNVDDTVIDNPQP